MRRLLCTAALFLAASQARAEGPSKLQAGGDVGILFRDEAGGNRSILPTIQPRISYDAGEHWRLAAWYAFAHASGVSTVFDARTQHHRLGVGGEWLLPVRKAVFVGGAGLAAVLMHTSLLDHGEALESTTVVRPAGWISLALEVPLDAVRLRWGATFVLEEKRQDVSLGIGVTLPVGER